MMPVEVEFDLSAIKKTLGPQNMERVNELLTTRVMSDTENFVPKDHGDLRGSADVTAPDEFTYGAEYAQYVYNMNPFANFSEPGTTSHWLETAKNVHMPTWEKLVEQELTGGA